MSLCALQSAILIKERHFVHAISSTVLFWIFCVLLANWISYTFTIPEVLGTEWRVLGHYATLGIIAYVIQNVMVILASRRGRVP